MYASAIGSEVAPHGRRAASSRWSPVRSKRGTVSTERGRWVPRPTYCAFYKNAYGYQAGDVIVLDRWYRDAVTGFKPSKWDGDFEGDYEEFDTLAEALDAVAQRGLTPSRSSAQNLTPDVYDALGELLAAIPTQEP